MKPLYKGIFAFILFATSFNCLFAQQVAVGTSYSFDFINKENYEEASGHSLGFDLYVDIRNHFTIQTGFVFSSEYHYTKIPLADFPLRSPNNMLIITKGPFWHHYNENYYFKSIQIPLNVSYKLNVNHHIDIYGLAGISFSFKLDEFIYGDEYPVENDSISFYRLEYYYNSIKYPDEHDLYFKGMRIEIALGSEIILSNRIKMGIEIQSNRGFNHNEWYKQDYYSLALTGKYYFDEIKRPKKKKD
jgi:hypothetical protein